MEVAQTGDISKDADKRLKSRMLCRRNQPHFLMAWMWNVERKLSLNSRSVEPESLGKRWCPCLREGKLEKTHV